MFAAVSLRAIASTAHAWMSGFWGFAVARSVLGFRRRLGIPGGSESGSRIIAAEPAIARNGHRI